MFSKNETVFYIDTFNGKILKGKFLDYDDKNIWLQIDGEALNTFVYSDKVVDTIFNTLEASKIGLTTLRKREKNRLLNNSTFILDICTKLQKHEGSFYSSIIEEVLSETVKK